MADFYPIVVDSANQILKELPSGDTLNLTDSTIKTKDLLIDGLVTQTVVSTGTSTIDLAEGSYHKYVLTGSVSITTISNAVASVAQAFIVEVQNGGSYAVTWPSSIQWDGSSAPALDANKTTIFVFISSDGGTKWRGQVSSVTTT